LMIIPFPAAPGALSMPQQPETFTADR